MLQLHHAPSTAAMAPHLILEELGVPFELKPVATTTGAHRSADYLRLNPNGLVPVLIDTRDGNELVLYESAAICLHLVDTHPEGALAPPLATSNRAHFYKWLIWLTNTLQAALIIYFYPERWSDDAASAERLKAHAERHVARMVDQLDAELAGHGKPWLLGEQYSAVDAYALTLCRWTRNHRRPARTLPALGPYLQRVLDRPATQRMFATEGLSAPLV